jgi:hypothetical protein
MTIGLSALWVCIVYIVCVIKYLNSFREKECKYVRSQQYQGFTKEKSVKRM